jgi:hypothetical protein
MTLAQRVRERCERHPGPLPTPCLLWLGAITGGPQGGYGQIRPVGGNGAPRRVHRVVWEDEHGPVPAGLVLDHLCEVRRCCEPMHLEPVTHAENIRRAYLRRRQLDTGSPLPVGLVA